MDHSSTTLNVTPASLAEGNGMSTLEVGETLGNILDQAVKEANAKIHNRSITEVTSAVDKDDLSYQTQEYGTFHQLEAESVADKLNHRAQMMRMKADEFDKLADSIRKSSESIRKDIYSFVNQYEEVLNVLEEHSHIKPKTTGG